jgi:hypothetical protein
MRLRKGDGTSCAVGGSKNFFARTRIVDRMQQRQRAVEKIKQLLGCVNDEDLQCFQRLSEQVHQVGKCALSHLQIIVNRCTTGTLPNSVLAGN